MRTWNYFARNFGYFLVLWAMTFIFSAVSGFLWLAEGHASIPELIVDGLWNMSKIGCVLILILLGFKILNEPK